MKDYKLKFTLAVGCIVGFFMLLGVVGDYDYAEQVILGMSYEEYDWAKDTLMKQKDGKEPSEREIAHWWVEHRSDYNQ